MENKTNKPRKRKTLTASALNAFATCPRRYYYSYYCLLHEEQKADALRFGTAFHAALEARFNGCDREGAFEAAMKSGESFTETDCAVLSALVAGYFAKWGATDKGVVKTFPECEFDLRLASGVRGWRSCGKIDGLAVLEDGTTALVEHKTTSEDISPDSEYWARLRYNKQLLKYILAARSQGWDVSTVVYDVIRKPTIRQKKDESVEAYRARLADDCCNVRPDFYFARREVPVFGSDLAKFAEEEGETARTIDALVKRTRKAERDGKPNPQSVWTADFSYARNCRACPFCRLCASGEVYSVGMNPPEGFRVGEANEELSK